MAVTEKHPIGNEDQDNPYEAMKARLLELQPLLGAVILQSRELFNDVFHWHPAQ